MGNWSLTAEQAKSFSEGVYQDRLKEKLKEFDDTIVSRVKSGYSSVLLNISSLNGSDIVNLRESLEAAGYKVTRNIPEWLEVRWDL